MAHMLQGNHLQFANVLRQSISIRPSINHSCRQHCLFENTGG